MCCSDLTFIYNLINQHDYYNAISCIRRSISSNQNENLSEIYQLLFKSYLSLNLFNDAQNVLNLMNQCKVVNPTADLHISNLNLLKTKLNERFTLKIDNVSPNDVLLISDPKISYIKASSLTSFKLCFSFSISVPEIELILETKFKQIDGTFTKKIQFEQVNNRYDIIFNFLNVNRIGYKLTNSDSIKWIFKLSADPIVGVVRGADNWLFLDNDSNQSIKQYQGELTINNEQTDNWNSYLSRLSVINNLMFLIVPSKESVFPQFYPYDKGTIRPIDQVLSILRNSRINFSYPLDCLRSDSQSYSKTETHWSKKAADSVLKLLFSKMGISFSTYTPPYGFKLIKWLGDLGSKCVQPEYSEYWVYDTVVQKNIVFSNFIDSYDGMIRKFVNESAFIDKKLVVFCGSSIFYCLDSLISMFRYVVFVWSNAVVIEEIIDFEKPDFVLLQINERFVVRSPFFVKKISDYHAFLRTDKFTYQFYEKIFNYSIPCKPDIYSDYMQVYRSKLLDFNNIQFDISEKELLRQINELKLFDEKYYLSNYSINLISNITPLEHYLITGWRKGFNPSKMFDTNYYLRSNNDVKLADICPLTHYVRYGIIEGRSPIQA